MPSVLIKLPGGEGVIRGEDDEIALTHDVTRQSGQQVQPWDRFAPIRLGLGDDRMLFGGLLPPGAVAVEVVQATGVRLAAAVGGGAYAVIFEDGEHGEPALGYRDASGTWVHRPLPAVYAHEPITDAEEPCPVCGAVEYEQYFVTEEWRAGRGMKGTDTFVPSPLIVCRVCGHQEHVGAISRFGRVESPEEDEAARAAREARVRAEQAVQGWYANKMALMGVRFPIYAADGWPARINGGGSDQEKQTSLIVGHAETLPHTSYVPHPRIEVTTSIESHQPHELVIAREALARVLDHGGRRELQDGLSDAAVTLWFRAARRRRVSGAHAAPVGEIKITIDGTPQPFQAVGDLNAQWVAVRHHHDLTITIAAKDIDPASLMIDPVADPDARLLGPKPAEPSSS